MKSEILRHAQGCAAITIALLVLGVVTTAAYAGQAHTVTVGTADVVLVPPGGDGNFSLTARIDIDGNVSGEWQDASTTNPGFHMRVTCLNVVGNTAWLNGVITQASNNALIGLPTVTQVVDNSPSGVGDQISFTVFSPVGNPIPSCLDMPSLPLFLINAGNVVVR